MINNPGSDKKRRSRGALEAAFCELALKKPLEKIHVKDICELAGYSNMAFYSNFDDKYDLAEKVIEDAADAHVGLSVNYVAGLPKHESLDVHQVLFNFAKLFLTHVQAHRTVYEIILRRRIVDDPVSFYAERYSQGINAQVQAELNGSEEDFYSPFRQKVGIMLLLNATKYWMDHDSELSADDFANAYCDLYFAQHQRVKLSGKPAARHPANH